MKKTILAAFCLMGAIACSNELEYQNDSRTVLTLELPGTTKTVLGDAQDGVRPVLWCKGDKISVNGVVSNPLDVEGNVLKADFVLSGQVSAPYEIIYPAGMVKDAATVTLPAGQKYAEGDNIVSGSMPMAGYSTTESVMMKQVCGILGIRLKMGMEANLIRYIEVTALGGEPVCGDFSVDFQNSTLSSEAKDADVIRMEVQKTFPAGSANTFNVILPAGVYSAGFQVKVVDENGRAMVRSIKGSRELGAGKLMLMPNWNLFLIRKTRVWRLPRRRTGTLSRRLTMQASILIRRLQPLPRTWILHQLAPINLLHWDFVTERSSPLMERPNILPELSTATGRE